MNCTVLGIESTAHTLSAGVASANTEKGTVSINANVVDKVPHTKKGFVPRLLAEHHSKVFKKTVESALKQANVRASGLDAISFSQGPGIGTALRVGAVGAKALAGFLEIPLLPVHHGIAHIEVGKWECGLKDPLVLYVSGGNTQILVLDPKEKRYRVLGETLDVGVGNFLDVFAREFGLNNAVEVMQHASKSKGNFIELPYTIKGMNVSYTGLLTCCARDFKHKVDSGETSLEDLCFSVQETVFAILTEAAERALLHSGKKELLACGGVACNTRLKEMLSVMAKENKAKFGAPKDEYNRDNGAMIALVGAKMLWATKKRKDGLPKDVELNQKMRPEAQEITWQ